MKFSPKHVSNALIGALKQGMTPRKLALTCALGVVIGLFPVFGTTTLLCFAVAALLGLNIPLIQLVNYLTAPLQLIMIVPFIKMGIFMFGSSPFPYTTAELLAMFRTDFWGVMREAGLALALGVGVWSLVSIPLFFLLFFVGLWVFQKWRMRGQGLLKSQ